MANANCNIYTSNHVFLWTFFTYPLITNLTTTGRYRGHYLQVADEKPRHKSFNRPAWNHFKFWRIFPLPVLLCNPLLLNSEPINLIIIREGKAPAEEAQVKESSLKEMWNIPEARSKRHALLSLEDRINLWNIKARPLEKHFHTLTLVMLWNTAPVKSILGLHTLKDHFRKAK